MKRAIYVPYYPEEEMNQVFIVALYAIAEYNKPEKRYNILRFGSIDELTRKLCHRFGNSFISRSTLHRLLSSPTSSRYWLPISDTEFRLESNIAVMPAYLRMTEREINLLTSQKSSFLAKYMFYVKYHASAKSSDFTAKQFLSGVGLCPTSHKHASKVSECNKLLLEQGLLRITPIRDENKQRRNIYRYIG